jgi:hypothetical protein
MVLVCWAAMCLICCVLLPRGFVPLQQFCSSFTGVVVFFVFELYKEFNSSKYIYIYIYIYRQRNI